MHRSCTLHKQKLHIAQKRHTACTHTHTQVHNTHTLTHTHIHTHKHTCTHTHTFLCSSHQPVQQRQQTACVARGWQRKSGAGNTGGEPVSPVLCMTAHHAKIFVYNMNVFFSMPFLLQSTRPITWNKISIKKKITLCDRPLVLSLSLSPPFYPPPYFDLIYA